MLISSLKAKSVETSQVDHFKARRPVAGSSALVLFLQLLENFLLNKLSSVLVWADFVSQEIEILGQCKHKF